MKPQQPTTVVWVLSDGKAGHYNQSKGVVLALAQSADVQEVWIEAPLRTGVLRTLLKWLLNQSGRVPMALLTWCYPALNLAAYPKPDVIVGAGGRMMYAVAALAFFYHVPAIFVGSLRGLRPELFHTVIVLEQHSAPQYLTVDTAPMPVSPQSLVDAAKRWQVAHPHETGELWAVLIGGDGAGANYGEQDWQQLAEAMNHLARQHQIRWLLTTSRRTGAQAERILKAFVDPHVLADHVWWGEVPRKVMAEFLGRAQLVCCTVESMSMLTEAVVAQRPVIGLVPQRFVPTENYQQALYRLRNRRWLGLQPIETWTAQHVDQQDQLKPMPQSALQQLAQQLHIRLTKQ